MDNPEEVLHSLDEYSKLKPNDIPRELEDYLLYVAKTGDPVFQWTFVKCLFRDKLSNTIIEFYETSPTLELPECPNVDIFNYESMKNNLVERLESFNSAPFTIQRLCELLTTPRKEYMRVDKFMRAIEKNILVVSTKEPGNTRRNPKSQTEVLVNGIERGIELGRAVETGSSFDVGVTHPYDNEVPINDTNKVDCSSTKEGVTEGYADSSTANNWEKESESSSKLNETESCDDEDQPINGGSIQDEGGNAPQLDLSHMGDFNKVTLDYSDETVEEAKLTSDGSPDLAGQNILSRELTSLDFPTLETRPVIEGEVVSTELTNPSGMVPPADQIQVIPSESAVSDDGLTSETPIEHVLFHKPSSDDETSIIKSSRVIFCGTSKESETTHVEHSVPETNAPTSNKENEDPGKTVLDIGNLVCEESGPSGAICSDGATDQTLLEEPVSMTVSDSGYIIVETISLAVQLTGEEEDSSKHSILAESPTAVAEMFAPQEGLSPVVEAEDVEGNGAKQVMEQEAMEVDEGSLDEPMDQDDQHVEAQNQS